MRIEGTSLHLLQGVHVKEIAVSTGVDAHKLGGSLCPLKEFGRSFTVAARCLRFLATNHIFREVSPDVFANNKISSLLDTGKTVATILEK